MVAVAGACVTRHYWLMVVINFLNGTTTTTPRYKAKARASFFIYRDAGIMHDVVTRMMQGVPKIVVLLT